VATINFYDSPDGLLRFLVVRDDDGDVSLGFDKYAWHTHGDVLATTYGLSLEAAVTRFIDELMGNRVVIAVSRCGEAVADVWISDSPEGDMKHKPEGESIEFRHWDGSLATSPWTSDVALLKKHTPGLNA
jgi:hypothetical protein